MTAVTSFENTPYDAAHSIDFISLTSLVLNLSCWYLGDWLIECKQIFRINIRLTKFTSHY